MNHKRELIAANKQKTHGDCISELTVAYQRMVRGSRLGMCILSHNELVATLLTFFVPLIHACNNCCEKNCYRQIYTRFRALSTCKRTAQSLSADENQGKLGCCANVKGANSVCSLIVSKQVEAANV